MTGARSVIMHPVELEFLVPLAATLGFFALIAWIVFVIADGRRRREHLKVTSEFNAAFLETEGGKRFMKTLTVDGPSAKTRMLGSTQTGIVCTAIGIAMLILGGIFYYLRDGLWVIGGIVTACGVGFIVSTVASYRLSKTLGLLEGEAIERR
jgi:hypothetical protein